MAKKESIKVRPTLPRDRFNDPIGDTPAWIAISGVTVVPRSSQEEERRGPIVISGFMVALNAPIRDSLGVSVPMTADWEVEIRGEVHQIEGDIGDYGRKIIFYTMRAK